jgi:exonuclease III
VEEGDESTNEESTISNNETENRDELEVSSTDSEKLKVFHGGAEELDIISSDTEELGVFFSGAEELEVFSNDEAEKNLDGMNIDPDLNYFRKTNWSSNYISLASLAKQIEGDDDIEEPSLTVLHINCRSITHKLTDINEIIEKLQVSIVALSETWLEADLEDSIQVPGYNFIGKARVGERYGGVGLLIKNNIKFQQYKPKEGQKEHKTYESLFIKIFLKKSTPIVGVIYRPPGQQLSDFNEEIDELVAGIQRNSKEVVLLGDFNIDLLKLSDHKESNIFYNCLMAHHYLPVITKPTRITPSSRTLIDNIYCTCWSKLSYSNIIISDLSDHLPIYARFSLKVPSVGNHGDTVQRIVTEAGVGQFKATLANMNWEAVTNQCEQGKANEAYELFIDSYTQAYNDAFPLREESKNKQKVKFKQPWMTGGLLKSCKKKNLLYTKYMKTPNQQNKQQFVKYRNKFKTVRINAEKNYYTAEFYKHQNDLKMTWKIIRAAMHIENKKVKVESLIINGNKIEDPEQIANSFNNYFTNIASDLANKTLKPSCSFEEYMPASCLNSMGLTLTSPEEIIKIGQNLKKTHSKGVDDIDPYIATPNLTLIVHPLTEIINCSLQSGIVPDALKVAKITPIFKKGDKENIANYRPISVLPYFAKYLEKIMYDRLSSYVKKANIIHYSQHGFQQGHSTFMALLDMEDRISKAIDNNEYSIGIFIDLAKAFDTVDHNILLKKIANYGIRGTQLKWFYSYFQSRTQRVMCNGAMSENGYITHGVPQGSNLGPLLFLLYINDLANVSTTMYFILFADDTNIFYSNSSWRSLMETVNHELINVSTWFAANRLTLNIDKTNFIIFKSHRKIKTIDITLKIDGVPITQVESTKFLGVYVDQHLTWKDHINYISSKIAKSIGIISRISYLLPKNIRLNLYYCLVYPYLTYCNLIWASNYDSRLYKITILQKKVVRVIDGSCRNTHSSPIFKDLKLLKIKQIRVLQIGDFIYRYEHNLLPASFMGYFTLGSQIHTHNTRRATSYRPSRARTNTRKFSMKSSGPQLWNTIPLEIRLSGNRSRFKKRLRTYLVNI